MKINANELATELASLELIEKWDKRPENLYVEEPNGDLRFNDEAQAEFHELYDKYHNIINQCEEDE